MTIHEAKWKNYETGDILEGRWTYNWAADRFTILLDSFDEITGIRRKLIVSGEKPQWGKWRLVDENI